MMEIIFLRHGIAEDAENFTDDAERELTKKSKKKVKKASLGLKVLLNKKKVMLYSSHLRRALQTSDILAKNLKVKGVSVREEIATGDFAILKQEFERLKENKKSIIIVGHEPHLSRWCFELTEVALKFKKASAASVKIGEDGKNGVLLWYLDAEKLAELV